MLEYDLQEILSLVVHTSCIYPTRYRSNSMSGGSPSKKPKPPGLGFLLGHAELDSDWRTAQPWQSECDGQRLSQKLASRKPADPMASAIFSVRSPKENYRLKRRLQNGVFLVDSEFSSVRRVRFSFAHQRVEGWFKYYSVARTIKDKYIHTILPTFAYCFE